MSSVSGEAPLVAFLSLFNWGTGLRLRVRFEFDFFGCPLSASESTDAITWANMKVISTKKEEDYNLPK
jgi:hypothetical protein